MRNNSRLLDGLFPRTRQNILGVVLPVPERRWSLSDLAQRLGVPPSSLQRELASLVDAGILSRETDGKRVYFQADPACPLLPDLQALFAKTTGLADQVRSMLEPFGNRVELAFIFGSVARGEQATGSDIDLLIVGAAGLADMALPLRDLERALQIPVNVSHYAPSEFRDKLTQRSHFLQTVLGNPKLWVKGSDDELANLAGEPENQSALYEQAGVG